ncbi:MAG: serine/threonine protein kinase [Deltaproteobacteria bacterium]|nr:serine/threonine protein kinase [Deltaproteobacteria bacterium]
MIKKIKGYSLDEKIGIGAHGGIVYKATSLAKQEQVAVRELPANLCTNVGFVSELISRCQRARYFDHRHIVNTRELIEENRQYYIVLDYFDGKNLDRAFGAKKIIETELAVKIAMQTAGALSYLHSKQFYHGDIRPHNLMIDDTGAIKISEVEMPNIYGIRGLDVTVMGTGVYCAPDLVSGKYDAASDIYALGVTLYRLATGTVSPFGVKPKLPSAINPEIPPELERIIMQAMAPAASGRFASAWEMMRQLGSIIGEENCCAGTRPMPQPYFSPQRDNRQIPALPASPSSLWQSFKRKLTGKNKGE